DPGAGATETTSFSYDAYGNLTSRTQELPAGDRTTTFCFDGDAGWCPGIAGHDSHSVLMGIQDPLGTVTALTPDLASGAVVGIASDFTDEPAITRALDPFSRVAFEYVTPEGGTQTLVEQTIYHDTASPPYVERLAYADAAGTDWDQTIAVEDGFGGTWKTIRETPSGYVGRVVYHDPEVRGIRETHPIDCDLDPLCLLYSGRTDPAAREVVSDALGRPIRVDTPDGFSLSRYAAVTRTQVAGPGTGSVFDAVLAKNGKGDLIERILDGDRVVWVDECSNTVPPATASLASVSCSTPDQTFYSYEATGEVSAIYDAVAVYGGTYADPNHRLGYTFDTLGRVVQIDDPDLEGTGFTTTAYDPAGNVASVTNARGQTRSYSYDLLDRLTAIATPAGEDDYAVSYRTNERQPWQESSDFYVRTHSYDSLGRVAQERNSVYTNAVAAGVPIFVDYLTDTTYDLLGQVTEIQHPDDSSVTSYEYQGRYLQRVCDLGGASDCGGIDAVRYIDSVGYDGLGRRTQVQWDGGTRAYSYDATTHHLAQDRFDANTGSSTYWFERNYTAYDELGNLKVVTGSSQPGDIDLNEAYDYDPRNRLASWTKEGTAYSYGYDKLGNLTTHANAPQAFDDPERPHGIQQRGPAGSEVFYSYDADGNVSSIIGPGVTQHFRFDSANRLSCAGTSPGAC
ncbi:MAG: hypothetical protein ACE5EV_06720, partial [Gaiellales bacterium]